MSELCVRFLGKEYSFPLELKKYVEYCNEFNQINRRLEAALVETSKKPPMGKDDEPNALEDLEKPLKQAMVQEGRHIISRLASDGIFNIVESDVIENNKGYIHYCKTYEKLWEGIRAIMSKMLESYAQGVDQAYSSASSKITGTGLRLYSNSLISHATFAAMELSAIRKQSAEAEKEYSAAIDSCYNNCRSYQDREILKLLVEKVYPEIATAFSLFVSELMEFYLGKLSEHSLFDYTKVKAYSVKRSGELLNNLSIVEGKQSVIEEAFKACPYNPDVYIKSFALDAFDAETFATAQEFKQDTVLIVELETYCKEHLSEFGKVKQLCGIISKNTNQPLSALLSEQYNPTVKLIEHSYAELKEVQGDPKLLDRWIRKNVCQQTKDIIKYTADEIHDKVQSAINNIVPEEVFSNLAGVGLLVPSSLHNEDSNAVQRDIINTEYVEALSNCVNAYVAEAIARQGKNDKAYSEYSAKVQREKKVIDDKKEELRSVKLFNFSLKKSLKAEIDELERNLSQHCKINDPVSFRKSFENMYQ